jgi:hypothetical protein
MKGAVVIQFPNHGSAAAPRHREIASPRRVVKASHLRLVKPARLGAGDVPPEPAALRTLQRGYDTAVRIARRAVSALQDILK